MQWCCHCGGMEQPAEHHRLVIENLQEVAESTTPQYVIIPMPPGSAKSTYSSVRFVPWFLAQREGLTILACSHNKDLAASFGRRARNDAEQHELVLGYKLAGDSRAVDEWQTSNRGRYFCAGVGSKIAGHRADLGLIDDYCGSQEEADSESTRESQWQWFLNDFYPRLKPNAPIVIIANRRHEADIVGRLTDPKNPFNSPIHPSAWKVISLPFFAEENDPLGRPHVSMASCEGVDFSAEDDEVFKHEKVKELIATRLWPEYFTERMALSVLRLPGRIRAGQYQQRPRPEDGNYFKLKDLCGYERQDLPPLIDLRLYGASDHACSEEQGSNKTVMVMGGLDQNGFLYILPELFWQMCETDKVVNQMLSMASRFEPLIWWAEKGHISKSIGPFLRQRMSAEAIYFNIEEVTPVRAKDVRARSFQALTQAQKVLFPKFAPWWPEAEEQLLMFPGGKEDDVVDALAHLGAGINRMVRPSQSSAAMRVKVPPFVPTMKWLKGQQTERENYNRLLALDR